MANDGCRTCPPIQLKGYKNCNTGLVPGRGGLSGDPTPELAESELPLLPRLTL